MVADKADDDRLGAWAFELSQADVSVNKWLWQLQTGAPRVMAAAYTSMHGVHAVQTSTAEPQRAATEQEYEQERTCLEAWCLTAKWELVIAFSAHHCHRQGPSARSMLPGPGNGRPPGRFWAKLLAI